MRPAERQVGPLRPHLILLVLMTAYGGMRLGEHAGFVSGVVLWYAADILCLPLVLGLIQGVQRFLLRSPTWLLPRAHGVLAVIGYSFYFEWVLPHFDPSAVGDPWDAVCYLLGWALFDRVLNRTGYPSRGIPETGLGRTVTSLN